MRHDLAEVPRARLIVTTLFVLLAILLARFSWGYPSAATATTERGWVPPIAIDAERALYDTRVDLHRAAAAGRAGQAHRHGRLHAGHARRDRQALAARPRDPRQGAGQYRRDGPKAIGIDILIDQPQPEDAQLLAAMKAMKTPRLAGLFDQRRQPQ